MPFRTSLWWGTFLCLGLLPQPLWADYTEELSDQIQSLEKRFSGLLDETYFRDMAVIIHKADSAERMAFASEILRSKIFTPFESHVSKQLDEINRLYETDAASASEKLKDLAEYREYLQPTAPFLETAYGRTFAGELSQERDRALEAVKGGCSVEVKKQLILAFRKTGFFATREPGERDALRRLGEGLSCCLGWKSTLAYDATQKFETDYDAGTIREESRLALASSSTDWNEAKWVGDWSYYFEGREGKARAVSQATLRYRREDDYADLVITNAKVDSSGRMNMPIPVAGDRRTLEVEGERLDPLAVFAGTFKIPLTGCKENSVSEDNQS